MALLDALNAGVPALSEFMGKQVLARIQRAVDKHTPKTGSFSPQVSSARDHLHNPEPVIALPYWPEKQSQQESASEALQSAKDAKTKAEEELRKLEADILEHRPPADELNREQVAYLGHDEIQVAVEDTGYRLVRHGGAATILSEGERTAIAFLYSSRHWKAVRST